MKNIEILNHVFHHANREYDEESEHDDVEVLGERGLLGRQLGDLRLWRSGALLFAFGAPPA